MTKLGPLPFSSCGDNMPIAADKQVYSLRRIKTRPNEEFTVIIDPVECITQNFVLVLLKLHVQQLQWPELRNKAMHINDKQIRIKDTGKTGFVCFNEILLLFHYPWEYCLLITNTKLSVILNNFTNPAIHFAISNTIYTTAGCVKVFLSPT